MLFRSLLRHFAVEQAVPPEPVGGARNVSSELALPERRAGDAEVMLGLTKDQAIVECTRCLRCDVREPCAEKG